MGEFWVVEGIDGAGKSHLLSCLTGSTREAVVLRKDALPPSGSPWADERLSEMHRLTWGYDHAEPVWHYPARFWLYSLAAWFELFHHVYVAPALSSGCSVVVDGWYFKHQARMLLSGNEDLVALAGQVFSALPQPNQVAELSTPPDLAAVRRSGSSKPSEHGAFITGVFISWSRPWKSTTWRWASNRAAGEGGWCVRGVWARWASSTGSSARGTPCLASTARKAGSWCRT